MHINIRQFVVQKGVKLGKNGEREEAQRKQSGT